MRLYTRTEMYLHSIAHTETMLLPSYPYSWEVLFGRMMGDVTWSWSMGVMSIPLPLSMYVVAHSLHVNACFAIGSYHLMNQT